MMARLIAASALLLTMAPLTAATETTGDRVDGTPVIERLDAASLPAGAHRFWFRAGDTAQGQGWYVPVIVIRGARPGPRLLLTAAIHGDELNGIDVIHQLAAKLDPATLAGTVTAVPGLNTPGILNSTREFTPGDSRAAPNLNRLMPGKPDGGVEQVWADRLWTRIMRPNADAAVDLHTQSRGTAYVLYAFASTPRARRMAELIGPDIIKLDKGVKGTVENEMVPAGVPAITLEIGRPEVFDAPMVARAVAGIENLMTEMGMLRGSPTTPAVLPFIANKLVQIDAPRGGYAHLLAALGSDVVKGQPLATISDPFGRITATVTAPESGRINTIATEPLREKGDMLARIVFWSPEPACSGGC